MTTLRDLITEALVAAGTSREDIDSYSVWRPEMETEIAEERVAATRSELGGHEEQIMVMLGWPLDLLTPEQHRRWSKQMERDAAATLRQSFDANRVALARVKYKAFSAWRDLAPEFWKHSYQLHQDDALAGQALMQHLLKHQPDSAMLFMTQDGRASMMALARWADQAFPVVQLHGQKYAAALMATSCHGADVRPPWKAFVIEVPPGTLATRESAESEPAAIRHILVYHHDAFNADTGGMQDGWTFQGVSDSGIMLWRIGQRLETLQSDDIDAADGADGELHALAFEVLDEDTRTLRMMTRLVLNTCLAMSDPSNVRAVGKSGWGDPSRDGDLPTVRRYIVGKPVKIDCRQAIHGYLTGDKRGPITVQFLVRGHWRNQACGPRMSEHKVVWIQPYWKGPVDAPINVRPHQLEK